MLLLNYHAETLRTAHLQHRQRSSAMQNRLVSTHTSRRQQQQQQTQRGVRRGQGSVLVPVVGAGRGSDAGVAAGVDASVAGCMEETERECRRRRAGGMVSSIRVPVEGVHSTRRSGGADIAAVTLVDRKQLAKSEDDEFKSCLKSSSGEESIDNGGGGGLGFGSWLWGMSMPTHPSAQTFSSPSSSLSTKTLNTDPTTDPTPDRLLQDLADRLTLPTPPPPQMQYPTTSSTTSVNKARMRTLGGHTPSAAHSVSSAKTVPRSEDEGLSELMMGDKSRTFDEEEEEEEEDEEESEYVLGLDEVEDAALVLDLDGLRVNGETDEHWELI
ncbi:hypothetical protein HDV05_004393 [Chytridiales sp. JEL 0842]|nr:hypothetical protein HDV05_004393 [Chytridiales sp. JEL 0842]